MTTSPILANAPVLIAMFGGGLVGMSLGAAIFVERLLPRLHKATTRTFASYGCMCATPLGWLPGVLVGGAFGKSEHLSFLGSLSIPSAMLLGALVFVPIAMLLGALFGAWLSVLWYDGEGV
jgi:hypothetical protein